MKRMIVIAMALIAAGLALAGEDTTGLSYLHVAYPELYTNGTWYSTGANTNAFDISPYKGNAKILVWVSAEVKETLATNKDYIVLQHAPNKTGAYVNVSLNSVTSGLGTVATATSKVMQASVDLSALNKWLRIGVTTYGDQATNSGHYVGCMIVAPHKD